MFTIPAHLSAKHWISIIEEIYDIPAGSIRGPSRSAYIYKARCAAIKIIRKRTELSMPDIGKLVNRDHSCVFHALKKDMDVSKIERELDDAPVVTEGVRYG